MSNCDSDREREREKEKERETETVPSTALPNCCETRLKWAFQYLRRDLANPHSVCSPYPTPSFLLPFFPFSLSISSPPLGLACQTFFALSFFKRICACLRCLFEAVLRRQLRQRCSAAGAAAAWQLLFWLWLFVAGFCGHFGVVYVLLGCFVLR